MPEQRPPRRPRESLRPEERLRRRADFLRCYERGRRRHGPLANLYYAEREPDGSPPRLGITVTRKVGGAVLRYRLKRRIREIYRRWGKRDRLAPYDILVHVKPACREVDFATLQAEIHRLLRPLTRPQKRAD